MDAFWEKNPSQPKLNFTLGQGVVSHLVNLAGFAIVAVAIIAGYSRGPQPAARPVAQQRP